MHAYFAKSVILPWKT